MLASVTIEPRPTAGWVSSRPTTEPPRAGQVDPDHPLPLLGRQEVDGATAGHPGRVDQARQGTPCADCGTDVHRDRCGLGYRPGHRGPTAGRGGPRDGRGPGRPGRAPVARGPRGVVLHPRRRGRRVVRRAPGACRRGLRRKRVGPGQRGRGGRRWPRPPPAGRGVAAGDRGQPDRHLPDRQACGGPTAGPTGRQRDTRLDRDAGQHRGAGGHRGRQRLQRVQGRRRPPDQEHGHRLRGPGHPGQRHRAPGSSRHR